MIELKTEIVINSSPEKIWGILLDFSKYPGWNPFLKYIKGAPVVGQKLEIRLEAPGMTGMVMKPTLLKNETQKELRWLGRLFFPGLFDGEHMFELQDNKNGTTLFIQREVFRGILVPILWKMIGEKTRQGFELMNAKLKEICEHK